MRNLFVKPIILLTLIASMFFVNSCELGEEDVNESDLIGAWDIGEPSVDMKVGPVSLMQFLKTTMMFGDDQAQALVDALTAEFMEFGGGTITFNEDYSCMMLTGDLEENGSWELDGNELFLSVTGDLPDDVPLTVKSLSGSSAVIEWEIDHEVDIDEDGTADFTATIIFDLDLSKL